MLASTNMAAMIVTSFTVGKVAKGRGVAVRNACLGAGFLVLLAANALLASPLTASVAGMFGACTLIGIHMGMTHGLTLSMLSGYMPHKDVPGAPAAGRAALFCLVAPRACTIAPFWTSLLTALRLPPCCSERVGMRTRAALTWATARCHCAVTPIGMRKLGWAGPPV